MAQHCPQTSCKVTFLKQKLGGFDLPSDHVDMICAFSVFTHMEHEDMYKYLVDARRVVRDGGKFVFSCLPLNLARAQQVFRASAKRSFGESWSVVRDVTTSVDMMNAISGLAGVAGHLIIELRRHPVLRTGVADFSFPA